ncbi:MAG: transcription elongation factor subunit Spt4 [Nanoarchaeota archaeon]
MAEKVKVCRQCKKIIESGNKCTDCGSEEVTDSFKGKILVIHPDKSTLAQNLKVNKKGMYALKLG